MCTMELITAVVWRSGFVLYLLVWNTFRMKFSNLSCNSNIVATPRDKFEIQISVLFAATATLQELQKIEQIQGIQQKLVITTDNGTNIKNVPDVVHLSLALFYFYHSLL
jgi:hypothetical protein